MPVGLLRRRLVVAVTLLAAVVGAGASCDGGGGGGRSTIAIHPACTILCEVGNQSVSRWNGSVFVSERTSPTEPSNFTPFHAMKGPLGNPVIPLNSSGVPDTYAVNEVWQRFPGSPVVFRAQVTPETRHTSDGTTDSFASSWTLDAQDATGLWSHVGSGQASNGTDADSPEIAALHIPQLMAVGVANPQVFACAGLKTEDGRARTTRLIEAIAANADRGVTASAPRIQDLLYGDRYFKPLPPDILAPDPPQTPPTPPVGGAGDSTKWGEVTGCAMRQDGDDLTTRELHMILVANGHLYYSIASDWGTVKDGNDNPISRFRAVSAWADVEQAIGVNYGPISSAAVVAQPQGVSYFFTAASGGGRYRIWHVLRRPDGTWRPAQEVLALSGDAPNGTVYAFNVAAARCPKYNAGVWDEAGSETVLALWGGPVSKEVLVINTDGSTYSAWRGVALGAMSGTFFLRNVRVSARPFAANGVAFP
jgi:hypothetical protein